MDCTRPELGGILRIQAVGSEEYYVSTLPTSYRLHLWQWEPGILELY
jgi:hypothetical protein